MCVIEASHLYRFYHIGEVEIVALRGVSLKVAAGELVAVMGPSGSGKSTLLACITGLDEPDGGYVLLQGQRLTRRPEAERAAIRAAHVGILRQSGNLFMHLSVENNIRLAMQLAHKPDERRIDSLLDYVELSHRRAAYPAHLSGGEVARTGLAVALAAAPPVLVADEPTGEVDGITEQHILHLLKTYCDEGGAIILVTHSEELAMHADRIVRLSDGSVVNA